jgi:PAS domain S-box-containing protein
MPGLNDARLEFSQLAPSLAALCLGLETLDAPVSILDETGCIIYLTSAATRLLNLTTAQAVRKPWPAIWEGLSGKAAPLTPVPRRLTLDHLGQPIPVQAWLRPLAGAKEIMVGFEDLSGAEARERETLLIFDKLQAQADDLFALYQISQFLSTAQELDQLCTNCLQELERITNADLACLFLVSGPANLEAKAWHGLPGRPPDQPDEAAAGKWFEGYAAQHEILTLPLLAEERPIGLILLGYRETSRRELRFLNTVAKEMGTAIWAMTARQVLIAKEQNLEAIVTGTTDAIIQVGVDRLICDFNPAAERLTGYAAVDVLNQPCAGVLRCADGSGCGGNCIFAQVLQSDEPIAYTELVVAGRGGPQHVAASVAALKMNTPGGAGAVAILRDISKQKQIEQMKSDFTGMVSHQLRTPLALLRGYSETLQHLTLSEKEQLYCISGIAATTAQLQQLVEQILDVSRIEAGRMALDCEPVELSYIIRRVINSLPQPADQARIKADLTPGLPLLYADAPRLEQALLNLLDNALKYSSPEGQVIIRAKQTGRRVQIQVRDNGIGVPSAEIELLFNKFQRASNARHLQLPGTGLGLFISRTIIEAHGGSISLTSEPGKGTCITFWIPIGEEV